MSNARGKKRLHIKVIKGYRNVWRRAMQNKPKKSDDATLLAARDYENFSSIEKLIKNFSKKNPFEHHLALSLGCGAAKNLAKIREFYPLTALFGIDTSRDALLRARKRQLNADINLICASMSHLPFKENLKFDMLIAGQSFDLDFEEDYLERILTEVTGYSSQKSRFYMTFYGTNRKNLELYKCTPIGNLLDRLGWGIFYGKEYCSQETPFAEGVFWVAGRSRDSGK